MRSHKITMYAEKIYELEEIERALKDGLNEKQIPTGISCGDFTVCNYFSVPRYLYRATQSAMTAPTWAKNTVEPTMAV